MNRHMRGDGDILELNGVRVRGGNEARAGAEACSTRRFLSVWFRCCHVYGRMMRNRDGSAYQGRCPKCGAAVRARIGPEGTSRRMFEAR